MSKQHIAAIHVLKSKLRLEDDDYRALLNHLTGKTSSKAMDIAERARVRRHMQHLAARLGLEPRPQDAAQAARRARNYVQASPMERKVWALWLQLGRDGVVRHTTPAALNAWVERQTGVSALRFCNGYQLHALIEALKDWQARETGRNTQ